MYEDMTLQDFSRDTGDAIWGRYDNLRYIQSAPWEGGTPMRHCRPMKPKNRAYKRAKTKAQRMARRNNRR